MREIKLTRTEDGSGSYRDIFINVLSRPENGQSTSYEEMSRTTPVISKLLDAPEPDVGGITVLLEDAEWELLCRRLQGDGAFAMNSPDLTAAITRVLEAKPTKVVKQATG